MKNLILWTMLLISTICGTFAALVPEVQPNLDTEEISEDVGSGFVEGSTSELLTTTENPTVESTEDAQTDIEVLKEKLLALETTVQQFSAALSDVSELKTSQASLDWKVGEIGLSVESIIQTNTMQDDHINAIQIRENTAVAFSAFISKTLQLEDGEVVIFDNVVTNYGAAYSDICGTFRAPVHGLYVFTVNFITDAGNNPTTTNLNIMINKQKKCIAYGDDAHRHVTGVCTVLAELRAGELVNVQHEDRHGDGGAIYNGWHTGFTGFLYQSL